MGVGGSGARLGGPAGARGPGAVRGLHGVVHPDLVRGVEAHRDGAAVQRDRHRARVGRDLAHHHPAARPDARLPEEAEQLAVRLRLLGDALHHEGMAGRRLVERDRPVRLGGRHARDRVAVRTRARHAEGLGQPLLDHRGERVLEPMRLVVRARPVQPEHVGEPALDQPMPAGHGLRDAEPLAGEADLLAAAHADVAVLLHAADRLGDGGGRDVHVAREPRPDHRLVGAREVVDGGQIVLDRGRGLVHGRQHTERGPRRASPGRAVLSLPPTRRRSMDFALTESQELIRKEVGALARTFSLDYWLDKDDRAEYPSEFVKAFADNGWLGIMVPEAYGGAGLGVTEAALMLHEICASGAGTSGASPIHFYVFPPTPLIKYGTEAMKRKYLPGIVSGETVMAFGVTEPNAGTDTSRIQTRAEKKGDRWVVNGRKVWTTNAQHATRILLLARTADRDPARPLRGMTLFFADFDRTAITVREIHKLGRAAVDSNEIFIDNLEIPEEDVVGTVGEGFYHLLDSLNPERIVIGIEAVGIGRAALERAVQYAKERMVFDRPIGKNQAIAHPLAHAMAQLDAAEMMCLKAAWLFDHGKPCGREANAAKMLAAEAGFNACDAALQTFGGFGYATEFYVE